MELINSKDEAILKVVFENPVSLANWSADFKKTKEELDQIDGKTQKKMTHFSYIFSTKNRTCQKA